MKNFLLSGVAMATLFSTPVMAQDHHDHHNHHDHAMHMSMSHDSHHGGVSVTPIGVSGDHLHKKGDWMLSYSYMNMEMDGNRNGTDDLSDADILATANIHGAPANLRVIPTEMTMNMHMIGGMVGVADNLTLMVMAQYLDNSMDHTTYNMAGTTQLGRFTTKSSGFGDTQVAGLFNIYERGAHALNGRVGLSLPTGSIDEEDDVLTPMNTTPTLRLPYTMQLGSGTYDFMPGLTYTYGHGGKWSFGTAYSGRIHMGDNDEDYTRGDWHELNAWAGYKVTPVFGLSANVKARTEDDIDGQDTNITAPVQTADPSNYGGEKIHLGFNAGYQFLDDNTVKASVSLPIYQDLNGPQLKDDYTLAIRFERNF